VVVEAEQQRDLWLSETKKIVNTNLHTGSRLAPSSQLGTFFPDDLSLESLENLGGLMVSSSDSLDFELTTSES
jgi:hypothetical protein